MDENLKKSLPAIVIFLLAIAGITYGVVRARKPKKGKGKKAAKKKRDKKQYNRSVSAVISGIKRYVKQKGRSPVMPVNRMSYPSPMQTPVVLSSRLLR